MARALVRLLVVCVYASTTVVFADVYQWEYVDPSDPSQGVQQSTTLAPDGAGVDLNSNGGLVGRDLTMAHLPGVYLRGYRLDHAIFDNAYLVGADLYDVGGRGMRAIGANFTNANLGEARFDNINLSGSNFTNADLTNAHMSGTALSGANFTGAVIRGVTLSNATDLGFTQAQLYQTASYQQHELDGIWLSSCDLSGWDLSGQSLVGARLGNSVLDGTDFSNAIVHAVHFDGSGLTAAQLYSTASYQDRFLDNIDLERLDMRGANFSSQSLVQAYFNDTQLSGANFNKAILVDAHISGGQYVEQSGVSFRYANLEGAYFVSNGLWEGADFTGANLERARISGNSFVNSIFADAIIRGAELPGVTASGFTMQALYSTASYKSGDLTNIETEFGDLTGVDFSGIDISGASFSRLSLNGADFRGATAIGTRINASLEGADFRNANLTNASISFDPVSHVDFRNADLSGASFSGLTTSVVNADFTGATIFGASFDADTPHSGLTAQQLYSTASYQEGLLGPVMLNGDLRGWDFRGQNLTGARFGRGAQLENTLWTGAVLINSLFSVNTISDTDFRSADIRGVQFSNCELDRSNFSGVDGAGAYFGSSSLVDTDFSGAFLQGARFLHADLSNSNFAGADLIASDFSFADNFAGANFSGADIRGANFSYATLTGFTIEQLSATRSFQQRDLSDIDFEGCDFTGADMSGFQLVGADFFLANVSDVNFTGAVMSGVRFRSATLAGANFTDADASLASFSRAILTDADFTSANVSYAIFSDAELTGADFSGANMSRANFAFATLTGSDFTGADARSAVAFITSPTITRNLIRANGNITGLNILADESMRLWDFNLPTPVPILVRDEMSIDPAGTLRIVFEDDQWGSTLHFESGISVSLAGTLELLFDDQVDVTQLVGTAFQVFDWTGVTPSGMFDVIDTSEMIWDLSQLYVTGHVTLRSLFAIEGDYNQDGIVNMADYTVWRDALGESFALPNETVTIGVVTQEDYDVWRANFGNSGAMTAGVSIPVPEPSGSLLAIVGLFILASRHGCDDLSNRHVATT